jgi:hypothetical protein
MIKRSPVLILTARVQQIKKTLKKKPGKAAA